MKIKWRKLIVSLAIPLLTGFASSLASGDITAAFDKLNKPPLTPPGGFFPIIWTVLYTLMGISLYLITASDAARSEKKSAVTVFAVQLAVNFLWHVIFFRWGSLFWALVWLIILWIWVAIMIYEFAKTSTKAAKLQLPYIIWVTFALYLNIAFLVVNGKNG